MAVDVQLTLIDRNNDQARRHDDKWQRRSYTSHYEATLSLTGDTNTAIEAGFDTIQFVYVRVTSASPVAVYVYKDLSPEYWSVDRAFLAFDTSISQLSLMAESDATVYIYLGGE